MKRNKYLRLTALMLMAIITFPFAAACTSSQPSVTLSDSTLTVQVGGTAGALAAILKNISEEEQAGWTCDDPSVVSLAATGSQNRFASVTGQKAGEATVTVTVGGISASCTVTVNDVATLALNKTEGILFEGETLAITALLQNAGQDVQWTSSDDTVAVVTGSGEQNKLASVTGVKAGTATVTAKIGKTTASCAVTVNPAVALSVTMLRLPSDRTASYPLEAFVVPAYEGAAVSWDYDSDKIELTESNTDNKIALVKSKVNFGQSTVTVSISTANGILSASCLIVPSAATAFDIDKDVFTTRVRGNNILKAITTRPQDGDTLAFEFEHGNAEASLVGFADGGGEFVYSIAVTGLVENTTDTLTVKLCDAGGTVITSAVCSVTVAPPAELDFSSPSIEMQALTSRTIIAGTLGMDSALASQIVWRSSAPYVAQVSGMGASATLEGTGPGKAVITASLDVDGYTEASFEVNVISVVLTKDEIEFKIGESASVKAIIQPLDVVAAVAWESADSIIATVFPPSGDKNATVTARDVGVTTVSVRITTILGNVYTAVCDVVCVRDIYQSAAGVDYELIDSCTDLGTATAAPVANTSGLSIDIDTLISGTAVDNPLADEYSVLMLGTKYVFGAGEPTEYIGREEFELTATTDYTVSGQILTINRAVLAGLGEGEYFVKVGPYDFALQIPVSVVTKVLKTAQDVKYMYNYAGETSSSFDNAKYYGAYFILGTNINATGVANMRSDYNNFSGILDGRGYTIDNGSWGTYGMFYNLQNAGIKNIAVTNATFTSNARLFGGASSKIVIADFSNVLVDIISASGVNYNGVIFGYLGESTFTNCIFYVGAIPSPGTAATAFSRTDSSSLSSYPVIAAQNVYIYCPLNLAYIGGQAVNVVRHENIVWLASNETLKDKGRNAVSNPQSTSTGGWASSSPAAGTLPSAYDNRAVFDPSIWDLSGDKAKFADKV